MPRLMVTDSYRDRLVTYYDYDGEITTNVVEQLARQELKRRGEIRERGINQYGCREWWVCDAYRKPVYIIFQGKRAAEHE